MFKFNKTYFILFFILLVTEIFIALFIDDQFIRPYAGDFLVVILIYCFLKTFIDAPPVIAAICVLLFSYFIETMQYFKIVQVLGLKDSRLANVVIGNSFAWMDIVAYTLGILAILVVEKMASAKIPMQAGTN